MLTDEYGSHECCQSDIGVKAVFEVQYETID
jgi:hypothetical protein